MCIVVAVPRHERAASVVRRACCSVNGIGTAGGATACRAWLQLRFEGVLPEVPDWPGLLAWLRWPDWPPDWPTLMLRLPSVFSEPALNCELCDCAEGCTRS